MINNSTQVDEEDYSPVSVESADAFNECVEAASSLPDDEWEAAVQKCYDILHDTNGIPRPE